MFPEVRAEQGTRRRRERQESLREEGKGTEGGKEWRREAREEKKWEVNGASATWGS